MAQVWLDNPIQTHLSPGDMMALHMRSLMLNSNQNRVPFYPRSPYGLAGFRGLGDCNYPADPVYQNCSAMDQTCVASNEALNVQHNIDVQAYHDCLQGTSYATEDTTAAQQTQAYATQGMSVPTPYTPPPTPQPAPAPIPQSAPMPAPSPQPGTVPVSQPAPSQAPAQSSQPPAQTSQTPAQTSQTSGTTGSTSTGLFGLSTTELLIGGGVIAALFLFGGRR